MSRSLRTLAAPLVHETEKVKGSRFLAAASAAESVEGAQEFVDGRRAENPRASHHCYAWRLGVHGTAFRYGDDGEPSGSAGLPILRQIDGRDLADVCVVVTRWFGGTKLGVGGLVRAYGQAAAEALDRAELQLLVRTTTIRVTHPYECSGGVQSILSARGLEPQGAEYGALVSFSVTLVEEEADQFLDELRERTAGRAEILARSP